MTHENRAFMTTEEYAAGRGLSTTNKDELRRLIAQALREAANEDLIEKRALQAQLDHIKAGHPVIVTSIDRTSLRVWNQERQQWAEIDLAHLPKGSA